MTEIDRISINERGFGGLILMENAGIRILEQASALPCFEPHLPVVCCSGSGNNGGDALVIARQIFSRFDNPVTVVILKEEGSDAYNFNLNLCRSLGIPVLLYGDAGAVISGAGIIFDGIAGTGINGALRGPAAALTEAVNGSSGIRFAVDLPSGTGESYREGYPAVRADYTFTVGLPKRTLYLPRVRPFCGEIRTVDIGFPQDLTAACGAEPDGRDWHLITDEDIHRLMPVLAPDDYKNSRGHLAVFAGSKGTAGAASLCAEAASRTAAGLVSLFADEECRTEIAPRHKAVMVKPFKGAGGITGLEGFQAAAVGPGWGFEGREQALLKVIEGSRGVLDADALTILASRIKSSGEYPDLKGRWVLTPHPGEFRRLFPDLDPENDPYSAVPAAAERLNAVVLLKGVTSFIAAPVGRAGVKRQAVLDGNCPALGTAGSGDLLCGIIGGYAASGIDVFDAAVLGAAVHLRAGRSCGDENLWFNADMLLDRIGRRS